MRIIPIFLPFLLTLFSMGAEKVLVWETSAPDLPGKVFLAGSIHVGRAEWYPLDAAYDKALNASSAMYFEIYKPDMREIAASAARHGMFSEGKSLSGVAGMVNYGKIKNFMAINSTLLPDPVLEKMRPWLLVIETASAYLRKHPEISQAYGLETVFTANQGNRAAFSLESVDLQFRAMSEVSDLSCMRMLMESINDFKNVGRDLERIMISMTSGSPENLNALSNEIAFKYPEYYQKIFMDRNRKMSEKIYELMKKKQTVFILVGAGHFAGRGNILELLRNKGCSTIQLDKTGKKGEIRPR